MNTHCNLVLDYLLFNAMAQASSYIESLDHVQTALPTQSDMDVNVMHHVSAYVAEQIQNLTVRDALGVYTHLHAEITHDMPAHLHHADRLVLLQLYLVHRVEHALALQFA